MPEIKVMGQINVFLPPEKKKKSFLGEKKLINKL